MPWHSIRQSEMSLSSKVFTYQPHCIFLTLLTNWNFYFSADVLMPSPLPYMVTGFLWISPIFWNSLHWLASTNFWTVYQNPAVQNCIPVFLPTPTYCHVLTLIAQNPCLLPCVFCLLTSLIVDLLLFQLCEYFFLSRIKKKIIALARIVFLFLFF